MPCSTLVPTAESWPECSCLRLLEATMLLPLPLPLPLPLLLLLLLRLRHHQRRPRFHT